MTGWKWQAGIAGAGIFLSSYDMGIMAMALISIKRTWHLTSWELSAVASITLVGMVIGSLAGGLIADRYGRRGVLLWDYVTFIAAAAISAWSPNVWWLLVARLAVGFGVGADFSITFAYLAEISPPSVRGRTMAGVMWFANFGTVIAYAVGSLFLAWGGADGWRWTLVTGALLAVPLVLLRSRVRESPMWQREHVRQGPVQIWKQLKGMRSAKAGHPASGTLALSAANYFLYQITDQGLGMFLPIILVALLGQSIGLAAWSSVLVKAVTIPAALATVFLIDRWGRRPLQVWGFAGRASALLLLGIIFLFASHPPFYLVVGLIALSYVFGPGGPDKTIVITPAEQFATSIRGTGEGLSEMAGRIGGIVGVSGYGILYGLWGPGAGLLFFGIACAFGALLSQGWLAETSPSRQTDVDLRGDGEIASGRYSS